MIKQFKDQKLMRMVHDICMEHHKVCTVNDSNMGYLWYMYANGSKSGTFKPFIFLAEFNLLVKLGYITEEEKDNLIYMLVSEDEDNAHIVGYSLLQLRNQRLDEKSEYTIGNPNYKDINYSTDVIDPDTFLMSKYMTTK